MKKILILPLALFFLVQGSMAQTPKWVEKAKRAVFSVVTYDKNDKMLNTGNGFFVSEDGLALSDFSLFKGAERAVVVTADGKQMPVSRILGANDMYDVIKFRVGITEKKVPALVVATAAPAVGSDASLFHAEEYRLRFRQGEGGIQSGGRVPLLYIEYADERQDGELSGDERGRTGVRHCAEVVGA